MKMLQRKLRRLAHELYCRERPRLALASLRLATAVGGGDSWLYDFVGLLQRDLCRSEKAIEAFRKAIHLDPSNDRARRRLANLAAIDGDATEALELLRILTAKDAASESLIHEIVSRLSREALPAEQALDWYRLVLKMNPDHQWAQLSEAHCRRELGDLAGALALYRQLAENSDDQQLNVLAFIGIATTLSFQGNDGAARATALQITERTSSQDLPEGLRIEVERLHEWLTVRPGITHPERSDGEIDSGTTSPSSGS